DEAEASGRETAAPEMPPPAEVPLATVLGFGQAVEAVVAGPPAPSMSSQGVTVAEDPGSKNASSPIEVLSPGSVYRPEWGVTNGSLLDTPEACQDLVDHVVPPCYFAELRHMPNDEFLRQYNVNLARQVAMGSQLRLRFEQEAKLLKKSVAQVARRKKRIQDRELEIKNLEVPLETEAEMKRAAEGKNAELMRELEDIRAQFSGLKVSNEHLSQQVAALQEQVSGEEKLKAAFEEFNRYEDDRWRSEHGRSQLELESIEAYDPEAEAKFVAALQSVKDLKFSLLDQLEGLKDAPMDVIMVALYLERIAKGMSGGLKHGVEHGHAQRMIESLEAYDPEAEAKFAAALQSLKDLKLPLLDQLDGLKDAPMDVIMASLYLEDDTGDDAPQFIRDLRPSSSQLAIPIYPESCKTEKEKPHSMQNSRGWLRAPCQTDPDA
nr:hypothetical protein [Tanacetum cinerariifolium]